MTRSKTDWLIAASVLVGAFLLRFVFVMQTRGLPFYYHPAADAAFFQQWAAFKKSVTWFDLSSPFREPLYAYFLASIHSVLRDSLTVARLVQAVLGGLSALVIYSITRAAFGRLAGVIAGVIFALSTQAIFFTGEISETTLVVFLLVSSAYLLGRSAWSRPYLNALLSGLLLGAAFLGRFAAIAALPAWLVFLAVEKGPRLRKASILLIAGTVAVPVAYQAVMVRGGGRTAVPVRVAWHSFLGSGSVGGTVRQPHFDIPVITSQGDYRAIVSADWADGEKDAMRLAAIETGTKAAPRAASAHWQSRVLRDFKSDPARYLKTYFTKLGMFWGPSEPPAGLDMRFVRSHSFLLKDVLFSFAIIAPLGVVGCLKRGASLLHLSLFLPAYSIAASFLLVADSDKVIVVPALAVFAGAVIAEILTGFRTLRLRRAAAYLITAALVGLVLFFFPHRPMDRAQQLLIQGDVYRDESIADKAEAAYREAIRLEPQMPDAYIALSRIYSTSWKPEVALGVLGSAEGRAAADPRLIIERASLLYLLGRYDEEIAAARPLEHTYPFEPRLHEEIGVGLLAKGDVEGAIAELKLEQEYNGGGFVTYSALGKASLDLGRYGEAAGYLEQAVKMNTANSQAVLDLADAYNKMGQNLKACELLARSLKVDPGNMAMRFKFANSLYWAGRYADALKQFKDLSGYEPKNADIAVNMGTVYAAMDSTVRAIETWEKALALDPNNQLAKDNLREARTPK